MLLMHIFKHTNVPTMYIRMCACARDAFAGVYVCVLKLLHTQKAKKAQK